MRSLLALCACLWFASAALAHDTWVQTNTNLIRTGDVIHVDWMLADSQGIAEFTPTEGNYYLVVVHHDEPDQKGDGYDSTRYTATLTVYVPQICPCCEQ